MKLIFLRKPGAILGFLFFLICFIVGLNLQTPISGASVYADVCHFVGRHIYLPDSIVGTWGRECVRRSRAVDQKISNQGVIDELNNQFSKLNTSHLVVYDSRESKKIWSGETAETGIESQYVEGELVVLKVHKNSPAEYAGLRLGDIIYRINEELGTPKEAETTSGSYFIRRDKVIKEYKIQAKEIKRDEDMEIVPVSERTAIFKVPSFRAEYFEKENWRAKVNELKKYQKIIVDLRGNLGGNFVAGLRLLSSFMCSPQDIGYLWKPKSKLKHEATMYDDLADEKLIEILDKSFLVKLWTFEGYECLASSVVVLVDQSTASTAEMVAQALKDYVGAKIFGSASAGQLLVGVWYPLPELGKGTRLSIPEAVYQTRRGHKIEGPGVQVDKVLYYHLSELQNGEDSWIKSAVQLF